MKKEILFKGKKFSGEWVEGDLILSETKAFIITKNKEPIIQDKNNWWVINAPAYQVAVETICQFTGCKDKDGIKVFEGDYDEEGTCVIWCEECHGWQFSHIDIESKETFVSCHKCEGNFYFEDHLKDFSVLGNINDK